jgi:hypothetical protein
MSRRRVTALVFGACALFGGCGIGNPWPAEPATPTAGAAHHELLMIGDSLLGQTDSQLVDVLSTRRLDVTVIDAHVNGTGLIGPIPFTSADGLVTTYPDALAWVRHQIEAHPDVDTVVVEYGGACATCGLWVPGSVAYGSDDFYARWVANAERIIDYLHDAGKLVLWTTSPQSGASGETIASGSAYKIDVARWLSFLDARVIAPRAGTPSPDWWTALNDVAGNFQRFLWYDGAVHEVRWVDLVHLEADGAVRTAMWTVAALDAAWAALPSSAEAGDGSSELLAAGDPVVLGPPGATP